MSSHIIVTCRSCVVCNEAAKILVPEEGYQRWHAGAFIQDALPTLTSTEREMLISGTHPECWDILFEDE